MFGVEIPEGVTLKDFAADSSNEKDCPGGETIGCVGILGTRASLYLRSMQEGFRDSGSEHLLGQYLQ